MRFDKRLFLYASVSSMATFGMSSAALAQGADEEVVVVGIRGALSQALDIKRESNAVVDAISAEDIGKFPDKNIAESLQRIPGVSINRGFVGEGNEVSIRGTNPELTQVMLNGQFVAATNWFALAANRRSFNMDLMPSELVSGVEVYKSSVAKLDEGGVGGTVILKTRKPLDLDPLTIFASLEIQQLDIADDDGDAINGLISWKNDAETFGILAAISSSTTIGRGNKAENYWEEGWSVAGISNFTQDRERETFDLTAQFAPSDSLSFTLHHFNTELKAYNTNQNFLVFAGSGVYPSGFTNFTNASNNAPSSVGAGSVPLTGTLTGGGGVPSWQGWQIAQDINTRRPELTTEVTDLNIDFEGNGFRFHGTIGGTESKGGNGGNLNSLWGITPSDTRLVGNDPVNGTVSVDFDMTLNEGIFMRINGLDPADGSWQDILPAGYPSLSETILTDEESYAQGDFQFDVDWGMITMVETGIKLRNHEFTQNQIDHTIDPDFYLGLNLADYQSGTIDVGTEVMKNGSDHVIAQMNTEAFDSAARANTIASVALNGAAGKIEEDITALYFQANFEGDGYRGNAGLRYVETDVTASTNPFVNSEFIASSLGTDYRYTDWLPSLNLALDLSDDMILRMSAARVMSRPGYSQLNPGLRAVNTNNFSAIRGIPSIDPFRAAQMDIGVEWYFAEGGLFSVTGFTKDISTFVSARQIQEEYTHNTATAPGGIWNMTIPVEGSGGRIRGLELQYQQAFDNGFGALANLTLSNGKGRLEPSSTNPDGKVDLPGNSEVSYNLTGYYENDIVAARLAYTYRDEFLAEGTAIGNNLAIFDEQAFLDASFTWHATDQLDVSVEMVNLLGEVSVQRHNSEALTNQVTTENGTRTYLKASFRM